MSRMLLVWARQFGRAQTGGTGAGKLGRLAHGGFPLILIVALVSLTLTFPLYGAFNATTQWDIQTTGLDTNAGAYDPGVGSPGTDESQGSGTAITVTATTTTGTGSPAFTSTTHGPGNFIIIASGAGCNTGTYEILSQAAGVATFDKTMGTGTCVGVIGGSKLTISPVAALIVTGNTVNIKAGTYTITSAINWPVSTVNSFLVIGYQTTHADGGTKPLITTATNSVNVMVLQSNGAGIASYVFQNLSLSSTAGTRGWGFWANGSPQKLTVRNSVIDGFSRGFNGDDGSATFFFSPLQLDNVEVKNCATFGVVNGNGNSYITDSYFHGNGDALNFNEGFQAMVVRTMLTANTRGIVTNTGSLYAYNLTVANNTGDGINFGGTLASTFQLIDSVVYGNGGWGVNLVTANADPNSVIARNNAYGANVSGNRNHLAAGTGDVTLSANPFTNSGAGDFSLNSTAGGGAAAKQAGFPGLFPGGTSTGFLDIGAVQTSGAPGTGGVSVAAYSQ
jgi:hypothetical protein